MCEIVHVRVGTRALVRTKGVSTMLYDVPVGTREGGQTSRRDEMANE